MRLSEAIRLGAMMKPQGFNMQFDGVATCALGAAIDAVGKLSLVDLINPASVFPILKHPATLCPFCGAAWEQWHFERSLGGTIAHLNDHHQWTREQIAEWVATIEATVEPPPAEDAVARPVTDDCLASHSRQ